MFSYLRAIYISSSLNSLIILFAPFSITGWYYLVLDLCITVFHLFIKYFCVYCVPRHCSRYWGYISTQWTKQTKIPTVVKAYSSPRVVCGHLLNCRTPAAGGGGVGARNSCRLAHCFFEVLVPSAPGGYVPASQEKMHSTTRAGICWYHLCLLFSDDFDDSLWTDLLMNQFF